MERFCNSFLRRWILSLKFPHCRPDSLPAEPPGGVPRGNPKQSRDPDLCVLQTLLHPEFDGSGDNAKGPTTGKRNVRLPTTLKTPDGKSLSACSPGSRVQDSGAVVAGAL